MKLAIHLHLTGTYAVPEPVGIWNEFGDSHYPPEFAHFRGIAENVNIDQVPDEATWEEWLQEKTYAVPTYGPHWVIENTEDAMDRAFDKYRASFLLSGPPPVSIQAPIAHEHDDPMETELQAERSDLPWFAVRPAARYLRPQLWWIANEFIRSRPDAVLHQDLAGERLRILNEREGLASDEILELPTEGTIRVIRHGTEGYESIDVMTAAEFLAHENPQRPLSRIDAHLRWRKAPGPRTRRQLAYQFITTALLMLMTDGRRWECKNEYRDANWDGGCRNGYLSGFPQAAVDLRRTSLEGWELGDLPETHFWALLCSDQPVAIVSNEARLYVGERVIDIARVSDQQSLHALVALELLPHLVHWGDR